MMMMVVFVIALFRCVLLMIHSGSVSSVSKYMGRLDIQQKSSKTYIDNIAQYIYCTMALDTHAQS